MGRNSYEVIYKILYILLLKKITHKDRDILFMFSYVIVLS